jgi:hypothetical protein
MPLWDAIIRANLNGTHGASRGPHIQYISVPPLHLIKNYLGTPADDAIALTSSGPDPDRESVGTTVSIRGWHTAGTGKTRATQGLEVPRP